MFWVLVCLQLLFRVVLNLVVWVGFGVGRLTRGFLVVGIFVEFGFMVA